MTKVRKKSEWRENKEKEIEISENSYTFIGLFFTHPDWYNKIK